LKALLLTVVPGLFAIAAFGQAIPQPGQTAPDFTLPSQDGSRISLHDFRGKWGWCSTFTPKDGTPGCTIEAPQLPSGEYGEVQPIPRRDSRRERRFPPIVTRRSAQSRASRSSCSPIRRKPCRGSTVRSRVCSVSRSRRATRFWWIRRGDRESVDWSQSGKPQWGSAGCAGRLAR